MSQTIDERIVELRFDNKAFEENIQSSIHSLKQLQKELDLSNAAKGFDGLSKASRSVSFDNLSSGVESIASKFSTLGIIGVTALQNITNSAVNAGKRIVSSLTIQPITTGFSEYELKMGSVQTIMASTGESIETVNKYLEELNAYSDRTIYSFSDMTQNIGKFTNAGVELKDAVSAIQGISNVAAVSGANAGEASRAMYNFAQAMSSGSVKLIDWKSIENANMATVEFKKQLMDTAVEMGTLQKTADGMYKSLTKDNNGKVSSAFSDTLGFNDSLSHQWMTSDVLVKTLSKYSDETTAIGKKAFAAAQEVKTLTQLYDTLKESAQSGWAASWEILVGDLEEAKAALSKVSEAFGAIIQKSADARNKLLKDWKNLGGRDMIGTAFANIFNGFKELSGTIGGAFRDIFPAMTGEGLLKATEKFKTLTEKFRELITSKSEDIRSMFRGVFSVVKAIGSLAGSAWKGIKGLVEMLAPAADGFMGLAAGLGEYLVDLSDAISQSGFFENVIRGMGKVLSWCIDLIGRFGKFIQNAFNNMDLSGVEQAMTRIKDSINPLEAIVTAFNVAMDGLRTAFGWLKEALKTFGTALAPVFSELGTAIKNADIEKVMDVVYTIIKGGLVLSITQFINRLKGMVWEISNVFDVFGSIESAIKSKVLLNVAQAVALLAASLFILSMVPMESIGSSFVTIIGLIASLLAAMGILGKILDSGMDFKGITKIATAMIGMSAAILVLSFALHKVGTLNGSQLISGMLGVVGLMAGLVLVLKRFDDTDIPLKTAASILIVAMALSSVARTLQKLGSMDPEQVTLGYLAIIAILSTFFVFVQAIEEKDILNLSAGILLISLSIGFFVKSIEKLGSMDIGNLVQGIGGLALVLAAVVGAMKLMPDGKQALAGSAAMLIMATAIGIFALSISALGSMDPGNLAQGLIAIGVALTMLVVAMKLMQSCLLGAATMIIMATALGMLVPVITILGSLSIGTIVKGLLSIAGLFLILGVAGFVLSPIVPVIMLLALSITALGAGALMAGTGMLLFATAMEILAVAGAAAGAAITAIITGLLGLIPVFFKEIGAGIVAFIDTIVSAGDSIINAVVVIISSIGAGLVAAIPVIFDALATTITSILDFIMECVPKFIECGVSVIVSFIKGIAEATPQIAGAVTDMTTEFLNAIGTNIPRIVEAGMQMLIDLLNGLAEAIENNSGELYDAAVRCGKAIGQGLINGIKKTAQEVWDGAKALGGDALDAVKNFLGINSPSKEFMKVGEYSTEGMALGMEQGLLSESDGIADAFKMVSDNALETVGDNEQEFYKVGESCATGFTDGLVKGVYSNEAMIQKTMDQIDSDMSRKFQSPGNFNNYLENKYASKNSLNQFKQSTSTTLTAVEEEVEETEVKMVAGIGTGINMRLAKGLTLYSKKAIKAAEDVREKALRPVVDMTNNLTIDTRSIDETFARLANGASNLNAELALDNNVTINHTFDTLRVEGVNDKGEFVASSDYAVEKVLASLMRRQSRV